MLGAFGAHALETSVVDWGLSPDEQADRLATWETAVRYQMYHALALLGVAWLRNEGAGRAAQMAGVLMMVGIVVFCGCLYAYVLSGVRILGAIVPIGGSSFIAGWACLAVAARTLAVQE